MNILKLTAAALTAAILAGCGGGDFDGAYRFEDRGDRRILVLNIQGDTAELFAEVGREKRIKPLVKMDVLIEGEKLLLEDGNSKRLAMTRNVDDQSLDCLNCRLIGISDQALWQFDPEGPYDVSQLLKDQARRDEEALNAKMLETQRRILEQAKRDAEAPKLEPYEGDWVYQRTNRLDPLSIMTIWQETQIKSWSFDFDSLNRLGHSVPGFEVSDAGLKIGTPPQVKLYTLSEDKQTLICMDCTRPERWAKADHEKDLSDRSYARQMAGNPQ